MKPRNEKERAEIERQFEAIYTAFEDCPDAVDWISDRVHRHGGYDNIYTRKEIFLARMKGRLAGEFNDHPYDPETDKFVNLVKWHRDKHGTSLKVAKRACEDFLFKAYDIRKGVHKID